MESVTDSLILWTLTDTDPNTDRFRTRDQILREIESSLPAAKRFIRSNIDSRLERLSKKDGTGGRKINYHKNGNKYVLPFETRQIIAYENAADINLKDDVSDIFRGKALNINAVLSTKMLEAIVVVCHRAVETAFERRGLELVKYVQDASGTFQIGSIDSMIVEAIERSTQLSGDDVSLCRNVSLEVLRLTFYHSEPRERELLQKLSRTYTFLLMIKNEPQVVEFFQTMTSQFVLYVGSDIIVRALSEHYLDEQDQSTCNMLKILVASKSNLVLTEKTLDEVCGNLRKSTNSYNNEYGHREPYLNADAARHIDNILVRAYFYAIKGGGDRKPAGWKDYINQFADYDEVVRQGKESLRDYLCDRFAMDFETRDEMVVGVDDEELVSLAAKIQELKKYPERDIMLAHNDASQVLRIFARRRELKENAGANPFGFRVWWLTQDSKVKRATNEIVKKYHGRFLMSPEFLMSFIDVIPNLDDVRKSFQTVFPTILGVKLSNRMEERDFLRVLNEYDKAVAVDKSRAKVILARLSNRLKGSSASEYLFDTDKALEC